MKGNNGSGNIEERDDWQTPQWLFDKLDNQYNFNFDCCASKDNHKIIFYSTDFFNFKNKINHTCWMNPPFSKAKEMFEHFFKVVKRGVCIYRCDNLETKIWQNIIFMNADWILIPKGRISYEGKEGNGSRFPSALIGVGVEVPNGIDGSILLIKTQLQSETKS